MPMMTRASHRRPEGNHGGASRGVALADLAARLGARTIGDLGGRWVTGVEQDSRRITSGDLFVALRGGRVDGGRFAPTALDAGAVAILVEGQALALEPPHATAPQLVVEQVRPALARAAADVHGHPTGALVVVGITGTNGKTTCAHLVEQCLRGAGHLAGIVGTLGYRCGELQGPLIHTSPEADELQRVARAILDHGASHLVMEVSSIALAADRVREVAFDVVAFTNLTQDHLDWHGSMEAYAAAKERLFFDYGASAAVVVIDQPFGRQLAERLEQRGGVAVIRVGTAGPAEVSVAERRLDLTGVALELTIDGSRYPVAAPLAGEHNVQNILCAAGIARALGLDLSAALGALAEVPQVPGRLELVSGPEDDVAGLVDYAHTPDALGRVLSALRPHVAGRLWCVFGCGGDRDPTKRAPMGEAVARVADVAVVTNDNPRSEEPRAIADAVLRGLDEAGMGEVHTELDRAAAIDLAVRGAEPGDVVLVAGKGHETYQIIGDRELSFDDRVVLGEALLRRRRARGSEGEG